MPLCPGLREARTASEGQLEYKVLLTRAVTRFLYAESSQRRSSSTTEGWGSPVLFRIAHHRSRHTTGGGGTLTVRAGCAPRDLWSELQYV